MKDIGFIGFGRMAQALYKGFERAGMACSERCRVVEPSEKNRDRAKTLGLCVVELDQIAEQCDWVFICVKPQQLETLLKEFLFHKRSVLISILAGKKLQHFECLSKDLFPMVRVMPNTPALLGEGATGMFFNACVSQEDKQQLIACFESVGEVVCVENEDLIDDITAISGSGPAFCYQLAKDWSLSGLALSEKDALKLIAQTFIGAGKMLQKEAKPEALIKAVKSPGGTTEAGLCRYEQENIGKAFQKVVMDTLLKAKALS